MSAKSMQLAKLMMSTIQTEQKWPDVGQYPEDWLNKFDNRLQWFMTDYPEHVDEDIIIAIAKCEFDKFCYLEIDSLYQLIQLYYAELLPF